VREDMKLSAHRIAIVALLLTAVSSVAGWGQAVSIVEITGTIRDQSGAVIPDADITATQTATGFVRTTKSGTNGEYLLNNLPVGPYQLRVEKQGFSTYVQSGLVLEVDSNPTINLALRVGTRSIS
jgi:hypothetical protein